MGAEILEREVPTTCLQALQWCKTQDKEGSVIGYCMRLTTKQGNLNNCFEMKHLF